MQGGTYQVVICRSVSAPGRCQLRSVAGVTGPMTVTDRSGLARLPCRRHARPPVSAAAAGGLQRRTLPRTLSEILCGPSGDPFPRRPLPCGLTPCSAAAHRLSGRPVELRDPIVALYRHPRPPPASAFSTASRLLRAAAWPGRARSGQAIRTSTWLLISRRRDRCHCSG